MNGKMIGGIVVVLVIVAAGAWYLTRTSAPVTPPAQQAVIDSGAVVTPTPQPGSVTITYTDSGFSPKSVSVPSGTTITFINKSKERMWVASDPHPAHSGYDSSTRTQHCDGAYVGAKPFDECSGAGKDGSFSFTFAKTGSWGYHNHAHDEMSGTIVVTAAPSQSAKPGI